MFVRFRLTKYANLYVYENVNLLDLSSHKFPSGRNRKCLNLVLDDGTTINFPMSEVYDLVVENYKEERHLWNDDAKIIFVEDGQVYEKR